MKRIILASCVIATASSMGAAQASEVLSPSRSDCSVTENNTQQAKCSIPIFIQKVGGAKCRELIDGLKGDDYAVAAAVIEGTRQNLLRKRISIEDARRQIYSILEMWGGVF